jgi:type IV pilus assembly protein PilQ
LVLRPAAASEPATVEGPLKISRETMDEAPAARVDLSSFGSAQAPATGAGQGTVTQFWVPPQVEDSASDPGADAGMIATLTTLDRRIDLTDFQGAPLEDVIRTIAKQLNLNILMDPGSLPGTVTMELYNVKLSEALDALLKLKGRGYVVERGGIVRIVDRKSLRSDEDDITIQVAAIAINWINVDDLEQVLQPFTSGRTGAGGGGGGSTRGIVASEHSNTLVIRDTPEKVSEIQDIIRQLDVPVKSVKMEVRLVDMTEAAARSFESNIDVARDQDISRITGLTRNPGNFAPAFQTTADSGTNGLIDSIISGANINASLDQAIGAASANSVPMVSPELYSLSPTNFSISNIFEPTIFGQEYRVSATLDMLETRNEAITLAAPVILSLDNQEANIEITRSVPYRQAQNTDQGSVATISFIDVGTIVNIRPRITNNGFVTMLIEPETSILTGFSADNVPIVDTRTAVSTVTVRDEEILAFGGLRQFDSTKSESGVPWLLRAPVIGWLFKGSLSDEQRKTELFFFVKPSIVKDPVPTAYEQGMFEKINYNWELPDYYFDEVTPRDAPGENPDPFVMR